MIHDLFAVGIPASEKVLRTIAVYAFLLVGLRLTGKREVGQLHPFDLVVLLLLSSTLKNALVGEDESLIGGVIGATALLVVNWLVVRFLYTRPTIARWLEADENIPAVDDSLLEQLQGELLTRDEFEAASRRQGLRALHSPESIALGARGALAFVPRARTEDDARHRALLARLDAIAETQSHVVARLGALDGRRMHTPPRAAALE